MKDIDSLKGLSATHPILFFDGVCNLCNGTVQFILARDPKAVFRFASLQSDLGQAFLQSENRSTENLGTVILLENGKVYTHSAAPLRISKRLPGLWPISQIFWIVPPFIRDGVYNWIAKNRYKWFGKKDQCWLPTPDLRERFLDS